MNERLREARKALGLTQTDFAKRIGVTNPTISQIENGKIALTERVVIAVCREFSINENWLRTGEGEMKAETNDTLIQRITKAYNSSPLIQAMIDGYMKLPEEHKTAVDEYVVDVARSLPGVGVEIADELAAAVEKEKARKSVEFDRPLTNAEQAALLRARADALEKGVHSSTILGNSAITAKTLKSQSGA